MELTLRDARLTLADALDTIYARTGNAAGAQAIFAQELEQAAERATARSEARLAEGLADFESIAEGL